MSTGYQIIEQDKPYYLTFQIVEWIDIFSRQIYRDIIIDSLKYCQKNKGLEIFAYVIMSNHIHIILRSGNNNLSDTIRDFKRHTSKAIISYIESNNESRKDWMLNVFKYKASKHKRNENYQVWTHENHAEILYSNEFIAEKVTYLHNNPVRAGIVAKPEDYLYSSAVNYADGEGLLEIILVSLPLKTL